MKTFIELFAVSSLLGLHSHDNTLPHINQLESSSLLEQVQGEKKKNINLIGGYETKCVQDKTLKCHRTGVVNGETGSENPW